MIGGRSTMHMEVDNGSMANTGYSKRSLVDKLGIKHGHRVAILGSVQGRQVSTSPRRGVKLFFHLTEKNI